MSGASVLMVLAIMVIDTLTVKQSVKEYQATKNFD